MSLDYGHSKSRAGKIFRQVQKLQIFHRISFFQKCYFYHVLQGTILGDIECSKNQDIFAKVPQDVKVLLLQRICTDTLSFQGHTRPICERHIVELTGENFTKKSSRTCFWPGHLGAKAIFTSSTLSYLSLEVCLSLKVHKNYFVPFGSGICNSCKNNKLYKVLNSIKLEGHGQILGDSTEEYIFTVSDTSNSSKFSNLSLDEHGQLTNDDPEDPEDPEDPNWSPAPGPEKQALMRKALNTLLELDQSNERCDYTLGKKTYFDLSNQQQWVFR